jgi:hypothetical protein
MTDQNKTHELETTSDVEIDEAELAKVTGGAGTTILRAGTLREAFSTANATVATRAIVPRVTPVVQLNVADLFGNLNLPIESLQASNTDWQ